MNSVPLKVFVTGASSDIGLVARRADALTAFAARFPHASVSIYPADVRDADADALADATASWPNTARGYRHRERGHQPRRAHRPAISMPSAR